MFFLLLSNKTFGKKIMSCPCNKKNVHKNVSSSISLLLGVFVIAIVSAIINVIEP